jgi:spore coat protein A
MKRTFRKSLFFVLFISLVLMGTAVQSKIGQRRMSIQAVLPGGTLDPLSIQKYATPLVIPPVMPQTSVIKQKGGKNIDYYQIAVRQFTQQILPAGMPATTVWSYGSVNHAGTFNYPAFTIEAHWNQPLRVQWINELVDGNGDFLPHILPVDQTLHWANPPGGPGGTDMRTFDPSFYTGPVPMVTHVHGAHTTDESDGYTEAWYLPAANNIPAGYATVGGWYDTFKQEFSATYGVTWASGSATFQYPNDQRATTLWYHDHSLGMTRLNVYAGPAGFYLVRGGPDDMNLGYRAPKPNDNPNAKTVYTEIPIVVQDRSFNADGSLFYPASREFFDGFAGPYVPGSDISPIWNPEFFGNTMVVNGNTWPFLNVEQRRYRFRFLNGCNSRFLILKMDNALPFWQIGAEGGFLPAPVQLSQLLMGPAERADVIVDFTNVPVGTTITLLNLGPDEPFGGGIPGVDFDSADASTTGQVMQFTVVPVTKLDATIPPAQLVLPVRVPLGVESVVRQVSLNEEDSEALPGVGPKAALLGTLVAGAPMTKLWMDPITENPALGATEVWEIYNFTMDAHPIHIHEIMFEVVNRELLVTDIDGEVITPVQLTGTITQPETWETGPKDTVIAYPGQVTRVKAMFDLPGLYVWHCHIVEHEDNEMMRPYAVGTPPVQIASPARMTPLRNLMQRR